MTQGGEGGESGKSQSRSVFLVACLLLFNEK